ncbi:hypothetical protein M9Y10_044893 [Tritrichomonas musculus]|uniref:Uncharacterized protein n=1 Tax=Tritrichomonas musculus TaxID=1915356 RepID=A0ABR2JTP2_9EUKA
MSQAGSFYGLQVGSWPKIMLLLFCVSGLFTTLLVKAVIHEYLLKHFHFNEPCFLTLSLFIADVASTFPLPYRILTKKVTLKAPITSYLGISLILAAAKVLMNYASLRITFTTGVLFKSCNLIPVMIGNIIFLKKTPKPIEIMAVLLYIIGLTIISLGDKKSKNEFNLSGIFAISIALILKAIAANLEELVMSRCGAGQDELIAMLYSFSTFFMFILSIITGQLTAGIHRIINNASILYLVLWVVFLGAISVQFIFLTIKNFGSLLTDMLLSTRKVLTVCLSFFVFKDKKFTSLHAIALCFIAIGMSINIYEKTQSKKNKAKAIEEINEEDSDSFLEDKKYENSINNYKNKGKNIHNANEEEDEFLNTLNREKVVREREML